MEQAGTSRHSASKSQYRDLSMKISIGDASSIYPRSTASVASAETKTNRTTSHHPSTRGMGDRVTRYIRVKCGPQHATKKEEAVRHNTLSGPPINIRPNAVKIYLLGSIPYVSPVQPRSAEPRRAALSRRGGCINPARAGCIGMCSVECTDDVAHSSFVAFFKKVRCLSALACRKCIRYGTGKLAEKRF